MSREDDTVVGEFSSQAREYWKSHGGRFTPGKEMVCRLIALKDSAFDVDTLWEEARRQERKLSISALYRIVADLLAADLIREIHSGGQRSFITTACAPAAHLRCRVCGKIVPMNEPLPVDLIRAVAGNSGFKTARLFLLIESECVTCGTPAS